MKQILLHILLNNCFPLTTFMQILISNRWCITTCTRTDFLNLSKLLVWDAFPLRIQSTNCWGRTWEPSSASTSPLEKSCFRLLARWIRDNRSVGLLTFNVVCCQCFSMCVHGLCLKIWWIEMIICSTPRFYNFVISLFDYSKNVLLHFIH